ncbi:MAG: C39 family peptidase [Elusimicrobia bacterium]|nr:C39 family peptidase [Elusimicrobiota bacterium]
MIRPAVLAGVVAMIGCAGAARTPPSARRVQLDVPFIPNSTNQCGPAALGSLLSFWGRDEGQDRLRAELFDARWNGSLLIDLLAAARSRGLDAEMITGDLDRVRKELDAGRPMVAFLNVGVRIAPIGHYVVITGYDDARRAVIVHSGSKRNAELSYRRFMRQWDRTDRWALVARPRSA